MSVRSSARHRKVGGSFRSAVALVAAAAVAAVPILTVGGLLTAPRAHAADPLVCDGSVVYAIDASANVRGFDTRTGSQVGSDFTIPGTGSSANALAISGDGTIVYAVRGTEVVEYNRVTATSRRTAAPFSNAIRGSWNPANGLYYFASYTASTALGVYDPVTNTASRVATLDLSSAASASGNGDFAFSASGELLLVVQNEIFALPAQDVPAPGSASVTLTPKRIADFDGTAGNGVAFGDGGSGFVSTGSIIRKINPASGEAVAGWPSNISSSATDLASCAYPNTVSLKKDIPHGRFASTDQFALHVTGPTYLGDGSGSLTVTTSGTGDGVQDAVAGPAFVAGGAVFGMREAPALGAKLANYDLSFSCVDNVTGLSVPATGGSPGGPGPWTVQQPTNLKGSDVVCTFVNDRSDITLTKQTSPVDATFDEAGDVLTYVLRAENTGPTALTDVTVTDPQLADLAFWQWSGGIINYDDDLAPGEWVELTGTYTVTQADVDAGRVVNEATVVGTTPAGDEATDDATRTTPGVVNASIDLVKTVAHADGSDAASSGGIVVGETLAYTFDVTNDGNSTLTDITLTDPLAGLTGWDSDWSDAATIGVLAPGEKVSFTARLVVTQAHLDAGGIFNEASVSAQPATPTGAPVPSRVTDTDAVTAPGTQDPSIELVKTSDVVGEYEVGDTITYTFRATNTGNVTLTGVTITDPLPGLSALAYDWSGAIASGRLAPTQSVTATATLVVTQEHVDAGWIRNTATASGTPPTGDDVEHSSTVTVLPDTTASIDVRKTGALQGAAVPGSVVTFEIEAENTGKVTLSGVTITDPLAGLSALTYDWSAATATGVLAPGETVTATASYTLTQADVDAGGVVNVATAHGTPPPLPDPGDPQGPRVPRTPVGDSDPFTVPTPQGPALQLVKTGALTNTTGTAQAGDLVNFELVATNTGNVTLTDVTVSDPLVGASALAHDWSAATAEGTLAPGEHVTVRATYELTQADVDAGTVLNVGSVTGTPPTTDPADPADPLPPVEDREIVLVPQSPSLTLDKTSVTDGASRAGDVVEYVLTARNTGNVTLSDVEIVDPLPGLSGLTFDWSGALGEGTLAPGEAVTARASYTLTQADVDRGHVANTAVATGTPPVPHDPQTGRPRLDPPPAVPLDPVEDDDLVTVTPAPGLSIVKTDDHEGEARVGEVVTYTIVATNTGNVTLTGVAVTDELPGLSGRSTDWSGASGEGVLAPGESVVVTASYTLTQADVDRGSVRNVASVTGVPPVPVDPATGLPPVDPESGDPVEAEPLEPVEGERITLLDHAPAITIVKTAAVDGSGHEGDRIDYTLVATNTGNVTLSDVTLVDELVGLSPLGYLWPSESPIGTLAPGESVTATASYVITADDVARGEVLNVATVTATPPPVVDPDDPDGPAPVTDPVTDDDVVTVPVGELPQTGAEVGGWAGAGAALLVVGGLLLAVRAWRRQAA